MKDVNAASASGAVRDGADTIDEAEKLLSTSKRGTSSRSLNSSTSSFTSTKMSAIVIMTLLVVGYMAEYYTGIFSRTNKNLEGGSSKGDGNETASPAAGAGASSKKALPSSSKVKKPSKWKKVVTSAPTFAPPEYAIPLTNDDLPKGYKKLPNQVSETYIRRGKALTDEQRKALADKWGAWSFIEPAIVESSGKSNAGRRRPTWDEWRTIVNSYSNGDVPLHPKQPPQAVPAEKTNATEGSSDNATISETETVAGPKGLFDDATNPLLPWQVDADYLKEWLPQAIDMVERSLEGILGEYGHSKFDQPDKTFDDRSYMFSTSPTRNGYNVKRPPGNAGYATPASLAAIQRRILHSVVTQGTFHVVMGGHSAAAGHGNHFVQSYSLQIQRVLEPILARLGVHHTSHNMGMGGMGTVQAGVATADLYGPSIDVLIWDSGMTEGEDTVRDVFARTGLLTGQKVPVLWGDPEWGRYEGAVPGAGQIGTGFYGSAFGGLPYIEDESKAGNGPFWANYINCAGAVSGACNSHKYNTTCWLPLPAENEKATDFTPSKQTGSPHGQAGWHPGNRYQQLQGRVIAFLILKQLWEGLKTWRDAPSFQLPDEAWHLTADFNRTREAVLKMKDTPCYNLPLSNKVCEVKFHAKSEFTPRYNPVETSIRSIIKQGVFVPKNAPNIYDPPEAHLSVLDAPDGEVDLLSIIENGIDYVPVRAKREILTGYRPPGRRRRVLAEADGASDNSTAPAAVNGNATGKPADIARKPITSGLEPGQGWSLNARTAADNCDGSLDSFCGRSWDNDCLLNGHNDNRGGLGFDSFSGWLIVNLYDLKHGVIFVRIEDYWGPGVVGKTENWKCENGKKDCPAALAAAAEGGGNAPSGKTRQRRLGQNPNRCDKFNFEFAIDGKITSWDKGAFDANRMPVQRVAHFWQLLNDDKYTGGESKDVELAIRLQGCGRETTFGLSHIYWA